jgi:hypothetical protein
MRELAGCPPKRKAAIADGAIGVDVGVVIAQFLLDHLWWWENTNHASERPIDYN